MNESEAKRHNSTTAQQKHQVNKSVGWHGSALGGSGAVRAAGNQEATTVVSSPPHGNLFIVTASSTAASPSPIQRLRVSGVPHAQLVQGLHNLCEHSKGKDHNTKGSFDPKRAEFLEFCDKVYG
ncbi:hypothetical protein FRACYDRAFT_251688 [Fragilariopsis cylindrus CCMP1102]|uniref:Uncharacterized protein n=1 Tax=Fragilariopsis cylindrus CCMP1102 TaxID=635003 RepID=A0A1E7EMT8_9STRA|nr:hypothetical protein FRACYDRAFT_251688 [Fragilariopsis cylindrus CCMP1102]|eukprot:OEU07157.1 hypothetical protein FRACYDRAFT_251688 [Fragilariopsis cylindrus CCMP1102]